MGRSRQGTRLRPAYQEKIEAVLEPEMKRLWADLVNKGMLSEEKEREVQIIQQKMH